MVGASPATCTVRPCRDVFPRGGLPTPSLALYVRGSSGVPAGTGGGRKPCTHRVAAVRGNAAHLRRRRIPPHCNTSALGNRHMQGPAVTGLCGTAAPSHSPTDRSMRSFQVMADCDSAHAHACMRCSERACVREWFEQICRLERSTCRTPPSLSFTRARCASSVACSDRARAGHCTSKAIVPALIAALIIESPMRCELHSVDV